MMHHGPICLKGSTQMLSVLSKLTAFPKSCIYSRRSHFCSTAYSKSWTIIVPALAQSGSIGDLRDAVERLNDGDKPGASPLVHLIRVSGNHGYVSLCRELHSYVIKHGFVSDTCLFKSLMRFYKTSDLLEDAHKLFDEMPDPYVIPWTIIFPALAQSGSIDDLRAAVELLNDGYKPGASQLVHILRVSGDLGYISLCRELHSYVIKHGFISDTPLSNSLIRFYKTSDSLEDAQKRFDEMPEPDVISWNSLTSGYVQSGRFYEGLCVFLELHRSDVSPNEFSFTAALAACARLQIWRLGACIHSKIVKLGIEKGNVVVGNCLIDMYGKCGFMDDAVLVFSHMEEKDIVSWNAIVASCSRNGNLELGLSFYHLMPNPDTVTYNELIDAFIKSGDFDSAFQILSRMPKPNSSSWNTILTGYVNSEQSREATEFFTKMHSSGVRLDEYNLSIVLAAISVLAVVPWGNLIHSCALKLGLDSRVVVASALVDMYSKCGMLKQAELMFWTMPRKNLAVWNAMISGYARNGDSTNAIKLFNKLKQERFMKPDKFTFLNLLAVCSHCEVPIELTLSYFEMMINEYGIKPSVEHCFSLIRAMGQRGDVWQGKKVIQEFGFGFDGVAWRALLGTCSARKDLKAAKTVAAKMIELGDADDEYVYIVMSNLYAYQERWREVSRIRKIMREKGVKKEVGSSWIQEQNVAIQI